MGSARGRPKYYKTSMRKTSIALPPHVVEALKKDAERSGFRHWSEQLRYEIMEPRGMWEDIHPTKPTKRKLGPPYPVAYYAAIG